MSQENPDIVDASRARTPRDAQGLDAEVEQSLGFRHLLVCLDRSRAAEAVLPLATHLARLDGARVTLLHVLEAPPDAGELRAADAIGWDIAREEARSYLRGVAARLRETGVSVASWLGEGSAPRQIASMSGVSADLIVLATHGEGGNGSWSLGGTARKVLDLATGGLLIVPAVPRPAAPSVPSIPMRRVFVPLDGSLRSEYVLPTAVRLARAEGAEVIVAHATPDPIRTELLSSEEDLALARELADRLAFRAETYLNRVLTRIRLGGPAARAIQCRSRDHRDGLVSLAARERADLVVLSAHGSGCDARRRFGSVASYFIAHSTAPVLVLQDLPEAPRTGHSPSTRPPPRSIDVDGGGR